MTGENICFRKSEVSIERIVVSLPYSTNDVIDLLPGCRSVQVLSTPVGYSLVAMVTDLCHHLTCDSKGAWHTVYEMLLSNYK